MLKFFQLQFFGIFLIPVAQIFKLYKIQLFYKVSECPPKPNIIKFAFSTAQFKPSLFYQYIVCIYKLLMIFNSISKELNTPKYQLNSSKVESYKSYSFLNRDNSNQSNHSKNLQYQMPEKESTLSQMNQKISDNLQYLRYKDYLRQKDLQSSRLSNSSQRSFRSNKSRHSNLSNSRASMQSPQRNSHHILTKKGEHYFPQVMQSKLQHKPWQTQPTNHYQTYKTLQKSHQSSQYRQFLRKPITIQSYNQKYGLTSSKHGHFQNQKVRQLKSNINTSYRSKNQNFEAEKQGKKAENETYNSPINKGFVNNLEKGSKLSKRVRIMNQLEGKDQKSSSNVSDSLEKQNQRILSPLEIQKPKNKGIIIAACLIGLGLLLLILQASK